MSDSDDSAGPRQALPVDDTIVLSGPPSTAEEYLAFVRREAKACPSVVTSKTPLHSEANRESYLAKFSSTETHTSEALLPSPEWTNRFITHFRTSRQKLQQVIQSIAGPITQPSIPPMSDITAWRRILFSSQLTPTTSILARLDQVAVCTLLTLISDSFSEGEQTLNRHSAMWTFGLLCHLDDVIGRDVQASLRAIMRHCATVRATKVHRNTNAVMTVRCVVMRCDCVCDLL
eukprot:c8796_g1_i1.p1 GENE.c8796_g1_i1~~c8796_g1_i1.p1  ORF type:complete len:232 (+),score=43.37 c8796_g1_i1:40-735(+)